MAVALTYHTFTGVSYQAEAGHLSALVSVLAGLIRIGTSMRLVLKPSGLSYQRQRAPFVQCLAAEAQRTPQPIQPFLGLAQAVAERLVQPMLLYMGAAQRDSERLVVSRPLVATYITGSLVSCTPVLNSLVRFVTVLGPDYKEEGRRVTPFLRAHRRGLCWRGKR